MDVKKVFLRPCNILLVFALSHLMKNRILFFVLLSSLFAFAQQGTIALSWTDNTKIPAGAGISVSIPVFDSGSMDYRMETKELFFNKRLPVSGKVDKNSLQITNIIYESVSENVLGQLSRPLIPQNINASVTPVQSRDSWYAAIVFSPIIKDGSGYKRVKSFTYSFSFAASRNFTTKNAQVVTNSVLATGDWYRFYVEKSGVYKISKSFLQQLGFNVNTDPRRIKIYGNGGRMLPLLNSTPYPMDLAENAISFIGEEDGNFDDNDYILFYAEGVDNWSYENETHINLYADRSYYYVTSQGGNGKRINTLVQPVGAPAEVITTFDDYYYHEQDLISVARLGRKWHGEAFNVENTRDFEFTIPDIAPGPIPITIEAAAYSPNPSSMEVKVNGASLGSLSFGASTDSSIAQDDNFEGAFTAPGNNVTVTLTYNNGGVPGSNAWLDYIILQPKRFLKGNGSQFRFRYNEASDDIAILEYQVSNASGINEVWDITNIYDVEKVVNDGASQFSFKVSSGEVREYITVVPSDYYTPLKEANARVANQNLKGTIFDNQQGQFQDIDYVIITPSFLSNQAEKLANLHRTKFQLNTKVVTLDKIYQEFSSGKQDIGAIRNFVKYIYENASSDANKIKYVNLFGDASFDFKDRIPNNTNIVPIFHAYQPRGTSSRIPRYSKTNTFCSDDFFVLMDADEGRMWGQEGFEAPDIAVGRMLVSSTTQAEEMVNKVLEYVSEESYGRWRNEYILIADDLEDNGTPFTPEQDSVYLGLTENRPFVNVRKIYADAFVQEASSGGNRYPQAKEQIINSINYGALVCNYLGHGGENGMASERIFQTSDIQELNNRYKYPLFITATCELTRFDNPYNETAGEFLYWNTQGGAIAMITTTRSIFAGAAYDLNEELTPILYAYGAPEYPSMAEALRRTKAELTNTFIRCVAFVGDPALMLAVPKPKITLTEINDTPVADFTGSLEALSFVKLKGVVTDDAGNPVPGYNGEVAVTVFDKPIERQTLGNDGVTDDTGLVVTDFTTLGEALFRGNASVTNSNFEVSFVVPRDIRIPVGEGRVSFYAKRGFILEDQTGYDNTIRIGGINEDAEEDVTGPTVRLYMNDESFISGGITNDSPIFLAFLQDEHGINTASGIGHDIVAILDGDENNPYILNDYYETDVDNYMSGSLSFPFRDLEAGLHTITFKAWDVYNNLVTAELQFVVVGDEEMHIEKVLNYPNPFVSYTEFWFTHNRPFEPLDVQVQVFTVSGKVVKTINQSVSTDGFLCRDIKWDGKDDFGDRIGKGVYIYKLTVRSATTGKTAEKYEKLVLL